jgi:hypothetical protein
VKTISLKKVSAIAVASLGFGLLSVVPAQAATPAFTGAAVGTTAGTTGTATAVTAVHGTVTRTAPRTWTAPLTLTITGTGMNATAEFTVAGTTATVAGTATSALSALAVSGTVTATSAVLTGTVTWTSAADTIASVLLAGDTYAMTYTVTVTGTATATAAAVNAVLPATTGTLIAPTAGSGSTASALLQQVNGQATAKFVSGASDTSYTVTSTGVGSVLSTSPAGGTATNAVNLNGSNAAGGVSWTPVTTIQTLSLITTSAVAGTQTLTFQPIGANGVPGTAITATITWGASPAISAQFSLLTLNTTTGTTATGAAADTTTTVASSSNSAGAVERFRIQVVVKDQNDVALQGSILGAKIDGTAGSLGISGTANSGGAVAGSALSAVMTSSSVGSISVFSNGVAGKAVITITATTAAGVSTALGTKTVTFVGSASKATVTQNLFVAKAGTQLGATPATTKVTVAGVATTPALTAEVQDSAGTAVVAGSTVKITSSDSAVIVAGTCVELSVDGDPATAGAQPSPGVFECPVSGAVGAASGAKATITFSVFSATTGLFSILATPITFTIGGAIAKSVISLDKASYLAGEAMTLLATSTDSSGNAAFDGQTPYASISSNKTLITLPATTKEIVSGKTSTTSSKGVASLFAPATPGSFTISGLATDAATGTAYSATGSVVDGNAALVTQIDALNAKIVALNALIAKIMKKLGVK